MSEPIHPTIYLGTAASVTGTNFDLSGCTVTLTTDPSNNFDVVNKKYADLQVKGQADRLDAILLDAPEGTQTIKSVVDLITGNSSSSDAKINMLFLHFFHKAASTASMVEGSNEITFTDPVV
jgi:hypothetical protein